MWVLPHVGRGELVKTTDDIRRQWYEVTKLLTLEEAPDVFRQASVSASECEIVVRLNQGVHVLFDQKSVLLLREYLSNRQRILCQEKPGGATTADVVRSLEMLIEDFTSPWAYVDDWKKAQVGVLPLGLVGPPGQS